MENNHMWRFEQLNFNFSISWLGLILQRSHLLAITCEGCCTVILDHWRVQIQDYYLTVSSSDPSKVLKTSKLGSRNRNYEYSWSFEKKFETGSLSVVLVGNEGRDRASKKTDYLEQKLELEEKLGPMESILKIRSPWSKKLDSVPISIQSYSHNFSSRTITYLYERAKNVFQRFQQPTGTWKCYHSKWDIAWHTVHRRSIAFHVAKFRASGWLTPCLPWRFVHQLQPYLLRKPVIKETNVSIISNL